MRFLPSILVFLAACLLGVGPAAAQGPARKCESSAATDRVALVIGNSGYDGVNWRKLPNAVRDADAVCDALYGAGFQVARIVDADAPTIRAAIAAFGERAAKADTALVYFAGHGFEYGGLNFLVPVNAPAKVAKLELQSRFAVLDDALAAAARAKHHPIVFVDACRTKDPVVRLEGSDAAVPVGSISLPIGWDGVVFYSTSRGSFAFDAAPTDSTTSPFARAVVGRLSEPNLEIASFFRFVKNDVKEWTFEENGGPQIPTPYGVFADEFFFTAARRVTAIQGFGGGRPRPAFVAPPLDVMAREDEPVILARLFDTFDASDIERAATRGDPTAQSLYGYMLHLGVGVRKDVAAARGWLEKSAAQNSPVGQTEFAWYLQENAARGPAGDADRARALALFEAAAAQGYAKAQSHLGSALQMGTLGPRDPARALSLFAKASEAGHVYATFASGIYGGQAAAAEQKLRAVAKAGNIEGNYWLCELYNYQNRPGLAAQDCLLAARDGYAGARAITALLYERGQGFAKSQQDADYWARLALDKPELTQAQKAQMQSLLASRK